MNRRLLLPAVVLLAAVVADPASAAGPAVFAPCASCHGAAGEGTDLAPDLHGVIGRRAGSVPDFAYSGAMRRSGKNWSREELIAFLANPQASLPGTRMGFAGIKDAKVRAAIVDYLATLR